MKHSNISGTHVCVTLIAMVFALTTQADNQKSGTDTIPFVGGGGVPMGIVCVQGGNPGIGDCYQVYEDTLNEIPLAIQIGLRSQGNEVAIPLSAGGKRWHDFFQVTVEDRSQLDVLMQVIPDTERITLAERLAKLDHRLSRAIPRVLEPQDDVSALARIVHANGKPLAPGVYHFAASFLPGAEEFFGAKGSMRLDFSVTVKPREPGDENAHLEERIERHYLWGGTLQLREIPEGKQVLERGLALVKDYLARGAGEEDGRFNLTPRYQAALLCTRLGRKEEAIAHLVHAYQGATRECKWQAYHFGLTPEGDTHGDMPWRAKDKMRWLLNRLRLEVEAERLRGPFGLP